MLQNLRNCRNIGITSGSPLTHIKYYVVNFKDTNKSILSIQQMYKISVEVHNHNQLLWNNIFTINYVKFAFEGVFCYKLCSAIFVCGTTCGISVLCIINIFLRPKVCFCLTFYIPLKWLIDFLFTINILFTYKLKYETLTDKIVQIRKGH